MKSISRTAGNTLNTPHVPPVRGTGVFNLSQQKVTVGEVKELVERFTKQERKELVDHIHYLNLSKKPTKGKEVLQNRDLAMWGKALAEELHHELRTGTPEFIPTPSLANQLEGSYRLIVAFNESLEVDRYQSTERMAWYRLVSKLLVSHSKELAQFVGAPLSMRFVLQETAQVPGLVDRAFPGYAQSGMIRWLWQSKDPG